MAQGKHARPSNAPRDNGFADTQGYDRYVNAYNEYQSGQQQGYTQQPQQKTQAYRSRQQAQQYRPQQTQVMPGATASQYSRSAHTAQGTGVGSGSAYAPYGQTTAMSRDYDQWAAGGAVREIDMNRGRKPRWKKVLLTILVILLVLVLGAGIGAFLYLNKINSTIDLGDRKGDVLGALTDQNAKDPYYILLLGSDSREGIEGSDAEWAGHDGTAEDQRSDVMILVRVDEDANKLTMLSIPRDTPWQTEDGQWMKLNSVYRYEGPQGSIKAISKLTGVPISHYVEIHMSGFVELVDRLGGVTVDVPSRIQYHEALTNTPVTIEPGVQTLNGAQAEVFARERYSMEGGDVGRQSNVRQIVEAMIHEIKNKPVWELPDTIAACAECVSTDYSATDILGLATAVGNDFTLYQGTGPTDGADNNALGDWYCYIDEEGWARVMEVVENGGDPSMVSYENDSTRVAGE